MIDREKVAEKLNAFLHHQLPLEDLVDWAENAIMNEEFAPEHFEDVRNVVAQLGLADVQAFGLRWEDCETFLRTLGYSAQVKVVPTG